MSFSGSATIRQRFWAFVKPYSGLLRVSALGNFFTVFLGLFTQLITKFLIDEAIPSKSLKLVIGVAIAFFMISCIQKTVGYCHLYLQNYVGQRSVFDIRKKLFHHLQLLH